MQENAAPDSLRITALIAYALFILAPTNGATAIIGAVLCYIKRPEARGTVYQSHFSNLLLVFWVTLVAVTLLLAAMVWGLAGLFSGAAIGVVAIGLALPAAYLGTVAFVVWYLYRTIKGLVRAIDARPYS